MISKQKFEQQMVALGQHLKQIRLDRQLSQQVLADQALVTRQQLQRIEDGTTNPTMKTLVRLADVLKVQLAFLLETVSQ